MVSFNSTSLSHAFRRTKEPTPSVRSITSVDSRDSKAWRILGLPEPDSRSERSRSISSSSTSQIRSPSLSETAPTPVQDGSSLEKPTEIQALPELPVESVVASQTEESQDRESTALPESSRLKSYPSTSTLRSFYDAKRAPLSVSQQTSASASRDFALRKGAPTILAHPSQETEHARQLALLKGARSSGKPKPKKLTKQHGKPIAGRSPPPPGHGFGVPPVPQIPDIARMYVTSSASRPESRQSTTSETRFSQSGVTQSHSATSSVRSFSDSPYAKINIRRPKAGIRHWFDGLEAESSEEEINEEPQLQQRFVDDVQDAFQNGKIGRDNKSMPVHVIRKKSSRRDPSRPSMLSVRATIMELPEPTENAPVTRREFGNSKQYLELQAEVQSVTSNVTSVTSKSIRSRKTVLSDYDLNEHSILSMSSSEDEEEQSSIKSNALQPVQPFQPAQLNLPVDPVPVVRESLDMASGDDTDVEYGLAQTVEHKQHESSTRPSRVQVAKPENNALAGTKIAVTVPANNNVVRSSSRRTSNPNDKNAADITEEADLLQSFPATPSTETDSSWRTSLRSSSGFSDNLSMTSTKIMRVTRQEERLLAAIRMKKAAMRAEQDTNRKSALHVLESTDKEYRFPRVKHDSLTDDQASIEPKLSNQLPLTKGYQHYYSLSGETSASNRDSENMFQMSDQENRKSQDTAQTEQSQEIRVAEPTSADSDHDQIEPPFPSPQGNPSGHFDPRDTYLATNDSLDAPRGRKSSREMLGDLRAQTVQRDPVPSHLFVEAPYSGWDKVSLMAH